jgi:hypothetical protein
MNLNDKIIKIGNEVALFQPRSLVQYLPGWTINMKI